MTGWNYIEIFVCVSLVIFLVWKEWTRANRSRLFWRIIATVVTVACLLCLIVPLTITVQGKKVSSSREAVLLTEGYHPDSLKKFLENIHGEFSLYTSDNGIQSPVKSYLPLFIAEPGVLTDSINPFKSLHVFGHGFNSNEIKKLNKIPVTFHPSRMPSGITDISWVPGVKKGDPLLVQGSFQNDMTVPVKLILNGLQTNLDSMLIPAGTQQQFELSTIPRHLGRAVYSLVALAGNDTVEAENIPVEVKSPGSLKILILASSPDFENKFLKNWLFKNGYQLVIRTTISRDKYQKEYLNSHEVKVDRISNLLLEKFDLVITDAEALAALPKSELATIRSRVEQNGMGLIVKTDSFATAGAFYAKSFPIFHGRIDARAGVQLRWALESSPAPAFNTKTPALIRKLPGTQPFIVDELSHIYCSSILYGLGKIVVTTLDNTFSWQLSGNDTAYHSLWSMILQKAAPALSSNQNWLIDPALPRHNEPVQLTLQSGREEVPGVKIGNTPIYFRQNAWFPLEWTGNYWPVNPGWQKLQTADGQNSWLYVYEDTAWKTVYAYEKYKQTKSYANVNYQPMKKTVAGAMRSEQIPLPKIYFFIMIIISAGYLWWEKKYSSVY